jgi:DNA repair exonuclease SbcCD ATPase subunit
MSLFSNKEIKELFARIERLEHMYKNHENNFLSYNSKMNTLYKNISENIKDLEIKTETINKENQLIRHIINDDLDIKRRNTERLKTFSQIIEKQQKEIKQITTNIEQIKQNMVDPTVNTITIKHDKQLEKLINDFKQFKKNALVFEEKKPIQKPHHNHLYT